MNQLPIKVYSKTDVHSMRKLIREETYKWIASQTDNDILQSIFRGFDSHNIILTEIEKKTLQDLIGDGKKWDSEKVRKEAHNFVKNIAEVIRSTSLDTLPESAVPSKKEEFDVKLYEESKSKILALAEKLKQIKEKSKLDAEMLEKSIGHIHEMQIEMINKQVEEIWKSNEEDMPEHFAVKELQMICSEMAAEKEMQALAMKRQEQIEGLLTEIKEIGSDKF